MLRVPTLNKSITGRENVAVGFEAAVLTFCLLVSIPQTSHQLIPGLGFSLRDFLFKGDASKSLPNLITELNTQYRDVINDLPISISAEKVKTVIEITITYKLESGEVNIPLELKEDKLSEDLVAIYYQGERVNDDIIKTYKTKAKEILRSRRSLWDNLPNQVK